MVGRAIAFMPRKTVARIDPVELAHHPVARNFGDNRGGGDTEALAVSAHDMSLRDFQIAHAASVDEHMLRLDAQSLNGPDAGGERGVINIEPIDFFDLGYA